MAHDESTNRLMIAWEFNHQDLEANRKGQLSERQMELIRKNRQDAASMATFNGRAFLIVFIIMLLVGVLMLMLLIRSNNLPISPAVLGVIGGVLVLALIVAIFSQRSIKKSADDAQTAQIELLSIDGPAKHISGRFRSSAGRSTDWYGVEVGGFEFISVGKISRQQAFVEGESYRIFYSKIPYGKGNKGQLWSAEAI